MHKLKSGRIFLIVFLLFVGAFLRFYKLSDYPVQLNHDEISQLYDTVSIVKTGKDIYGNFLPLAFQSTGDYKIGHYIYISTIPYLLFGDKEFTIRIPSAFFGTLTIASVFLFIFVLTKNFWIAFFSASLVAFTPSEIFFARKSFENVIGVCLIFFGLYYLFKDLENLQNRISLYIGILFFSLAMYVYTAHTIVVPLMITFFVLVFKKKINLKSKSFLRIVIFWILLMIPLIFITVTNSGLRFRAQSVSIIQDVGLGRQLQYSQNSVKTYLDYIFLRYLNQFNPIYIFGNGLNLTNQGLIGMGPLLFLQLPLLLMGIIFVIRTKIFVLEKKIFLLGLFTIPFIPSALTFEPFSPHRSMLGFTVFSIISGFGLYWMIKSKRILTIPFIILFFLNFVYFTHMYTVSYPFEKSENLHYPFKQIAVFAWSQYNNFDQIIIDPTYGESAPVFGVATQYYLAYYGKYPPSKFQKDLKIKQDGMTFDKFYIRKVNWLKDQGLKDSLIIASPWDIPIDSIDKEKVIGKFYFYDGKIAFYAIKL